MTVRPGISVPVEAERVTHHLDGSVSVERVTTGPVADRRTRRPSLAALLTAAGLATYEQITEALEEGMGTGEKLGEVIVRHGWASEEQLAELLAEQWHLPFLPAESVRVEREAAELLAAETCRELGVLPLRFDGTTLVAAVAEPNAERFAHAREALGDVTFVVVARSVLDDPPLAGAASDGLAGRLAAIQAEVAELEDALRAALDELAAARLRNERNEQTIHRLESALETRDDLLEALRTRQGR